MSFTPRGMPDRSNAPLDGVLERTDFRLGRNKSRKRVRMCEDVLGN